MSWFKNLKIKVKLITSFIVLAMFTGVVGIIGISAMGSINTSGEDIYKNNFVPALSLANLQTNLQDVRANHLLALYEQKPEALQSKIDQIDKMVEENNKIMDAYEKTLIDEEDRGLYNKVKDTLIPYRDARNANLEMVKSKNYEKAIEDVVRVTDARLALDKNVKELIDYNTNRASAELAKNKKSFTKQTTIMISVIAGGILLALLFGLYVASIISKPINRILDAANKIADGDLDVEVNINSKDEVGTLGKAFKRMTDNMNDVMSNINSASEQVASGAKQVSDSSMALSQGATEQASSIEQLTASIEEISSQTNNNAQNAVQANELAELAKRDAEQGNNRMGEMLRSMDDINESSSNISKIIKVIDEIAFQTNILALNAAVEAARAGQHGKGFAVVAEEVRNLAARSADAAKETTALIEGSIKKVEDGTKIATDTADALNKIVEAISKVANLVGNIAIASNEQASGISQVNQGVMQVSQVVQTNSATSEESAAASEELSSQAELLSEMVRKFKLKRNNFAISRSENVNPEVLKMIEHMGEKEKAMNSFREAREQVAATRNSIDLSDKDFGKY